MTSIARSMKRHGLTTKPSLRLVSAVESGGEKHYVFDMNGEGLRHTVSAADFWRGADTSATAAPVLALVPAATEPPPPAELAAPAKAAPAQREYIRVRDMKPGDIILPPNTKKSVPREVIRVVRGTPTFALHYVWEGEAALRTANIVPGARFILVRRGDR